MTIVACPWCVYPILDKACTEEMTGTGKVVRTNKGATAKKLVLDDADFWSKVRHHVGATLPIFKMLRRFDMSAPAIGKVYSSWFELGKHLEESNAPHAGTCVEKHVDCWAYRHSDFAAAAYVVDPEFLGHDQASDEEVTEGFMRVLERIAILCKVRDTAQCTASWVMHGRRAWQQSKRIL